MSEESKDRRDVDHLDWPSTDLERTADFYGRVFGWSFKARGTSMICENEGEHVGAFHLVEGMPDPKPWPLPVIAVRSIDDALRDVITLEGTIIEEKTLREGTGWMARVADPDGNVLGLVEFEDTP